MGVRAVREAAAAREGEYVAEVVGHLFGLHVESAEALDARDVDERAALREFVELAVGCGVHARAVRLRHLCGACVGLGHERVEQGRLAHSRVSGQQGGLSFQQLLERFDARAVESRHGQALVVHAAVYVAEQFQACFLLVVEFVHLVEGDAHRHAVCLGRGQEAVDEGGARFGPCERHHQQGQVHVGGQYVALLREVRGFPHNVVAPFVHLGDVGRLRVARLRDGHAVAHGHGVGRAYAAQAEVSLHLAVHGLPAVRAHRVDASGRFDNFSVHRVTVVKGTGRRVSGCGSVRRAASGGGSRMRAGYSACLARGVLRSVAVQRVCHTVMISLFLLARISSMRFTFLS